MYSVTRCKHAALCLVWKPRAASQIGQKSWYCLGCGEDVSQISPKERRNIGRESSAASEPGERVLSLWTILLKQEFEDLDFSFKNIIILLIHDCVYTRKLQP